ncbi:hypothetical protein BFU36_11960 [Sulfolobus sp. A20]|nr:hypothetical protein BFU36_11960 [Sulfolobus sp. A20]TRM75058.1 hypothetical protein DJ532_11155 [Sulfolobus sp. A20-N-F8]TRM86062.1 hypothetical protein DJ529_12135 [Sulfolobus sp. C3]TRN02214.1 hypothetical protein DJ527_04270 [Sulfolobus sp. F1]TRN03892.1 hypothetical protein DJ530_02260 [Sulfolobus sp. E1]
MVTIVDSVSRLLSRDYISKLFTFVVLYIKHISDLQYYKFILNNLFKILSSNPAEFIVPEAKLKTVM